MKVKIEKSSSNGVGFVEVITPLTACGPAPLGAADVKHLVQAAAHRYDVDETFAEATVWAESGFDRSRNSEKGARGPMQLMPGTAQRFGVKDICDPYENIEGGMKYLRVLFDKFKNPLLVAAAYNAGEQEVVKHNGLPPFRETINYVAKVMNFQLSLHASPLGNKLTKPLDTDGEVSSVSNKNLKFINGIVSF